VQLLQRGAARAELRADVPAAPAVTARTRNMGRARAPVQESTIGSGGDPDRNRTSAIPALEYSHRRTEALPTCAGHARRLEARGSYSHDRCVDP
jgi:hypothetical protein